MNKSNRGAMDLLGDIVEKDTATPFDDDNVSRSNVNGFPELYKPTKISSWRQRLQQKEKANKPVKTSSMSEAQSIHVENLKTLKNMSPEDISKERQELFESLDPKLIHTLLKNMNKRSADDKNGPIFAEIEGAPGTWVGGTNEIRDLPSLNDEQVDKALGIFNESPSQPQPQPQEVQDVPDDEDDVAPLDFQMAQSLDHMSNEELLKDVHFVKHDNDLIDTDLKLDDPDFDDKLHAKYFPDLPKDIEKLKWMQPISDDNDAKFIRDVSQCRFDFNGNLVPPTRDISSTTHTGLHHHSDDPQLAGYTIPELQRLSRSTFPAQRSVAIQTLGRILYKLGKQSYYQLVPEVDLETYKEDGSAKGVMNKIYSMFWDLCKDCRIIECLQDAADECKTRHLSVRNYALDALWLWKRGGGDFREKVKI